MKLTNEQIREFYHRGYIKIPGAVSRAMVDRARQAMNHSIGSTGPSKEDLANNRGGGGFGGDLRGSSVLSDLYHNSPIVSLAESLLGEGNLKTPLERISPAPRFPKHIDADPSEPMGHIDNMGNGRNGKPKGTYKRSFTCFGVIYLADVPEPYSGNFTVWSGSHHVYQDFLNKEGIEVLAKGQPRIPQPESPEMITGEAGDLILAHFLVYHTAAPNVSPNIRYATISRMRHVDCEENGNDCFTDIWREFSGVREVMGLNRESQTAD